MRSETSPSAGEVARASGAPLKERNFHNAKRGIVTSDQDWFYSFELGARREMSDEARQAKRQELQRKRKRKAVARAKHGEPRNNDARAKLRAERLKRLGEGV